MVFVPYLLEYEEIVELARGIDDFKGLIPGERIIAYLEDGQLIVLEGNRRVSACKLLLDRTLIPAKYNRFSIPHDETKINIERVNIDLVKDRLSTQSTLYNRHIEGVKKWPPISKYKFFANEFEHGMKITKIAEITSSNVSVVKKGIKEYNLLLMALNLKKWNEVEKHGLNLQEIKISPFIRVFSTKSELYNVNGYELLKMIFNEHTLKPISELKDDVFEQAIYLVAKAAFFDNEFDTRNKIDDVTGLLEFLSKNNVLPSKEEDIDDEGVVDTLSITEKDTNRIPDKKIIKMKVIKIQNKRAALREMRIQTQLAPLQLISTILVQLK